MPGVLPNSHSVGTLPIKYTEAATKKLPTSATFSLGYWGRLASCLSAILTSSARRCSLVFLEIQLSQFFTAKWFFHRSWLWLLCHRCSHKAMATSRAQVVFDASRHGHAHALDGVYDHSPIRPQQLIALRC